MKNKLIIIYLFSFDCCCNQFFKYSIWALSRSSIWEGGISKDKYPEVGKPAHEAYLLLEGAARDLLPAANPARQQALVASAWSLVHGFATLTLERELEVVAADQGGKKLLRQSLHLLLDQFAS